MHFKTFFALVSLLFFAATAHDPATATPPSVCAAALAAGKINPVTKSGDVWQVDPFLIPPKGRCDQIAVDATGRYLPMDFDAYPNITARCDDRIKFVMRTVGRQQRHGVYIANGTSFERDPRQPLCPKPLFNNDRPCNVRLNTSHQINTQCEGNIELYPLLMFGPNDTIVQDYTTPTLRTLVAAGKDTDTLVFTCPWIQSRTNNVTITTHCINGMYVRVTVEGCATTAAPTPGPMGTPRSTSAMSAAAGTFGSALAALGLAVTALLL